MSLTEVPQAEHAHVYIDPSVALAAYARHRRRFAAFAADLDAEQLATGSRCTEWSVADCFRHGVDVDGWMRAIWTGQQLPFSSFTPSTTPHEFVVAGRSISDTDARDRFIESSVAMAEEIEGSSPDRWGDASFSPLGFVPWWLSAMHAFFDSWMHERDVMVPLGMTPPIERDESETVLAYTLALAASVIRQPFDETIAGVRVVAGSAPTTIKPVSPPAGDEIAPIVDALSGRDDISERLAGGDPAVLDALRKLERFLTAPPR